MFSTPTISHFQIPVITKGNNMEENIDRFIGGWFDCQRVLLALISNVSDFKIEYAMTRKLHYQTRGFYGEL